ncbi:hypothetical protein [Planctomycetes bacterium K23_9]|uniref:Uncharacterized protein n=1 Tax=Stieleria marina TaxID=1930275 RepID=A0A517NZ33_9BACT|nr:hypothetical protein K239x_43970 [Planctomycetes bacterium K23_9]
MQLLSAKSIAFVLGMLAGSAICASAQDSATTNLQSQQNASATRKPITLISSGVKYPAADVASGNWNRAILLSNSKIVSGDIEKLSSGIRDAATAFSLTILATVSPPQQPGGQYVLRNVGVGYSVPIRGVPTIVTESTANELGGGLGFISRKILGSSVTELAQVNTIVQTTTLLVFDAPSVMLRNGKHLKLVTRHMIWIDPVTGEGATIVWLLGNNAQGQLTPVNEPLRLFAHGTKESKRIHVDGNEFSLLGFPNEKAFALEDLPPGKKVPWTRELAAIAALPKYSLQQIPELSQKMNDAIAAAQ